MKTREVSAVLSFTSPSAASTVVSATVGSGAFTKADILNIDAVLTGAVGGTLDIVLQRQTMVWNGSIWTASDDWVEWARLPQVIAAQAKTRYTFGADGSGTLTIQLVGGGTTAAPGAPVMTVGTYTNVMPGGAIRAVSTAGASTSAGAAQLITITPFNESF